MDKNNKKFHCKGKPYKSSGFRDILIETYINPVTFILEQHKVEIGWKDAIIK